jgi:hypothetical protein
LCRTSTILNVWGLVSAFECEEGTGVVGSWQQQSGAVRSVQCWCSVVVSVVVVGGKSCRACPFYCRRFGGEGRRLFVSGQYVGGLCLCFAPGTAVASLF